MLVDSKAAESFSIESFLTLYNIYTYFSLFVWLTCWSVKIGTIFPMFHLDLDKQVAKSGQNQGSIPWMGTDNIKIRMT